MFWQKKDDKRGLPDLPALKTIPQQAPRIEEDHPISSHIEEDTDIPERHVLPSFPDSPTSRGFSQAAIKEAVNPSEEIALERPNTTFKTLEMDDDSKPMPSMTSPISSSLGNSIAPPPSEEFERYIPAAKYVKQEGKSDIYVKIDKFYNAKRALESVKDKMSEIDELLKRIRETKLREDQELTAWEKEMTGVKNRIREVTENIFERLE